MIGPKACTNLRLLQPLAIGLMQGGLVVIILLGH